MNYKVTYYNDFTEPFYSDETKFQRRLSKETVILENKEDCISCVKDFLDVPTAELSLDEIKKDFGNYGDLSELKALQIADYYNGRLGIYNLFIEDFKTLDVLCYDIPLKFNSFSVEDPDVAKLHNSYIKILLTNEEI